MTALTTAELTSMRTEAESILTSSCTIQTLTRASDGMGGWPETWASTYTTVACLLSSPTRASFSDQSGNQFKAEANWRLSLHWDQAIAVNNRVLLNSDTFEVSSVDDDQDMRILRQADVMRIEG